MNPVVNINLFGVIVTGEEINSSIGSVQPDFIEKGRTAWLVLHQAAVQGIITPAWLAATFTPLIPIFGCSCLSEWEKILAAIHFRPDDQFAWSVEVHNAISRKLGKPEVSKEEADKIWRLKVASGTGTL